MGVHKYFLYMHIVLSKRIILRVYINKAKESVRRRCATTEMLLDFAGQRKKTYHGLWAQGYGSGILEMSLRYILLECLQVSEAFHTPGA